jgi:glycosyltransferase involved in cell wall biosynthesis
LKPTIAVLSHRAPFPLTGGAELRINRLIRGLSTEFEVLFMTLENAFDKGGWDRSDLERTLGVEVFVIPGEVVSGADCGLPSVMRRFRRVAATRLLGELVDHRGVRLIQYEQAYSAQNGPIAGAVNVLDAHNVEYEIARQLEVREWSALRDTEHRIWRQMDACLAVSPVDARTMRSAGARFVVECPNGSDALPRLPPCGADVGPIRVLFVGKGSWEPYERGLAWLVNEVLPHVRRRHAVALHVVGTPPREPSAGPDVSYCGAVESLSEHYRRAEVVVVPVFEGSGTRIKVIEAMRYGRPVVSTRRGVEGLPVQDMVHHHESDSPEEFAAAIVALGLGMRGGDPQIEAMVERARAAVRPLEWTAIARRLAALYRDRLLGAASASSKATV